MAERKKSEKGSWKHSGSQADLEARLSAKPTFDTDLMEFMAIAGWRYSLPGQDDEGAKHKLRARYDARRQQVARNVKRIETHLMMALAEPYLGGKVKTVGNLKEFIEKEGLRFRGLGYKGLAYLNETLQAYGLEPISVGGRPSLALLRRYGLKPSKDRG